jgi:hypothetical protein
MISKLPINFSTSSYYKPMAVSQSTHSSGGCAMYYGYSEDASEVVIQRFVVSSGDCIPMHQFTYIIVGW